MTNATIRKLFLNSERPFADIDGSMREVFVNEQGYEITFPKKDIANSKYYCYVIFEDTNQVAEILKTIENKFEIIKNEGCISSWNWEDQ